MFGPLKQAANKRLVSDARLRLAPHSLFVMRPGLNMESVSRINLLMSDKNVRRVSLIILLFGIFVGIIFFLGRKADKGGFVPVL